MNSMLPLSTVKITVPTLRPEILSRPRLLKLLDEILDKRLILVTAPAGYGKTSLLVDWAHTTELPVCWLSLDELDQESQRFLSYFIAALKRRFPRFGRLSDAALRQVPSLDEGLENLVVTLVNEIAEQIDEHFVIVLDDYQYVDGVTAIRNFVSRFLERSGENCHLVLATRRLPTLPDIPLLVARQLVSGFDLEELAFQPEEIRRLFETNYEVELSDADVRDLMRQTEGWVTGLHLARMGAENGLPDLTRAARSAGVNLDVYFDQQVFSLQPPPVRDFLLQTSYLDEFNPSLCNAVLGVGDWPAMIAAVRRSNLFVLPVGPRGEWLRYHRLFQDFLQRRLLDRSPQTVQAILLRLAEVSEENGEWERAYHLYSQHGDPEVLAGLIERAGTPLIQNDQFLTLGSWLDALPDSTIRSHPGLLSLQGGVALMRGHPQDGLTLLGNAVSIYRTCDKPEDLALALVRRAVAHRLLGDYQASLADAHEALDLPAESEEMQLNRAEACRTMGLALLRLGQPSQALPWTEQAIATLTRLNAERNLPMVLLELGIIRRAIGDNDAALAAYEQANLLSRQQGNLTLRATIENSLGVMHHMRGEYEAALRSFEQGLADARRSGYPRPQALLFSSLGDLYVELDDMDLASQAYENVEVFARQARDLFLLHYVLLARAGMARADRDFERARLLLDEARTLGISSASHYDQGLYELESGRLGMATRAPARAASHFQAARAHFETGGLVLETGWAYLWSAAACAASGEPGEAERSLLAVDGMIAKGASLHSLGMTAWQVREWLGEMESGRVGSGLKRLLDASAPTQAGRAGLRKRLRRLSSAVRSPAPLLVIRGFGKCAVHLGGHLVTKRQWKTRAVEELFYFFLNASEPLTKEQVGMSFWPDASPAQLKLRFKNNLYRLRNALGAEVIVFDQERYSFNRRVDYQYDVEDFEEHLRLAEQAADDAARLGEYRAVVELARGAFLENLFADWIEPERERLRQALLSALLGMADLQLGQGHGKEALEGCQRALSIDPCLEKAHRLAMRVYARQGDRGALQHQYQTCRQAVATQLGLSLSPETEALYRELVS
jgi:ATP/maltotriose-dependent transcriptional regulator MalT/DNA-binding SARP family transcriptional activator